LEKEKAPVFFIGHGSPMNALQKNQFTGALSRMRDHYPDPKAILCISAHWMTEGTWVTHMANPKTIHDFHGFPQELFEVKYPAPGDPRLAAQLCETVLAPNAHLDDEMWGLDHGTWSVLRHMFPDANVPVVQLSLHMEKDPAYHYALGHKLRKLRSQGVLIVGSGNIVHNLRKIKWDETASAYPWAVEFDNWAKTNLLKRKFDPFIHDYHATEAGRLSVPTLEHYLPLLYVLGASEDSDQMRFEYEGVENGSISMRTISFGA
jgi:4,5-DOPA dioxygenase extradiol